MSAPLEGSPSDDQKQRLEDWLVELKLVCRSYGLLLDTEEGETHIIDLARDRTIGIGLTYLLDAQGRITGFDCTGSILDGVWLVDGPRGPVEQRELGTVWPRRAVEEKPA